MLNIINKIKNFEYPDDFYKNLTDRIIGTNPIIVERFNLDYDGDVPAVNAVLTKNARKNTQQLEDTVELHQKYKQVMYTLPHEALYAYYRISKYILNKNKDSKYIENVPVISDFKIDFNKLAKTPELLIKNPDGLVQSYFLYSFNKYIFNTIEIKEDVLFTKSFIKDIIYKYKDDKHKTMMIAYKLNLFGQLIASLFTDSNILFTLNDLSIKPKDKDFVSDEIVTGFAQNNIYIDNVINNLPQNNMFKKLINANVGLKLNQLKTGILYGYSSNLKNEAMPNNNQSGLLNGIDKINLFLSSEGARLALAVRESTIPKAGELLRVMYFVLGFLTLDMNNDFCGTEKTLNIYIKNKDMLKLYHGRHYKDPESNTIKLLDLDQINPDDFIGKTIHFYSPMFCKSKNYTICKTCWSKQINTRKFIGMLTSMFVPETLIQSSLETHHNSGTFSLKISDKLKSMVEQGIEIIDNNTIKLADSIDPDEYIKEVKSHYEDPHDIDMEVLDNNIIKYKIKNIPKSEDATKTLRNLLFYIDKNQTKNDKDWIGPINNYFALLEKLLLPSGTYSVYVELILSILYYTDDNTLMRYANEDPTKRIAIHKIIEEFDAVNKLFFNYSATALVRSQQPDVSESSLLDNHPYNKLLNFDF